MAFDHTYTGTPGNDLFDATQQGFPLTDTWLIDGLEGDDTLNQSINT